MKKVAFLLFLIGLCACSTTKQFTSNTHRTIEVKNALLTLSIEGQQDTQIPIQIQIVSDSICILSIQPITGMEVAQLRADTQHILLIDRINKQYITIPYTDATTWTGVNLSYKDLESLLSRPLTHTNKPLSYNLQYQGKKMRVTLIYPSVLIDQTMRLRLEHTDGYNEMSIQNISQLLGL